jgi:hypothetical protein
MSGPDLQRGPPGKQMWRPLSLKTNLGGNNSFVVIVAAAAHFVVRISYNK